MPSGLEQTIEATLHETGYHPDCAAEADAELNKLMAAYGEAGQPPEMVPKLKSQANDAVLMQQKYFAGRLKFLTVLVTYLGDRPEDTLAVADDGCGTGADLYVLRKLLGNKLALTGIDKNEASLQKARERVPDVTFGTDLTDNSFEVIYGDFVSIDDNMAWSIAERGAKTMRALRSPGVVLQNADMHRLGMYCQFFGRAFSRIVTPEVLANVPQGPSCYLCRFEKD